MLRIIQNQIRNIQYTIYIIKDLMNISYIQMNILFKKINKNISHHSLIIIFYQYNQKDSQKNLNIITIYFQHKQNQTYLITTFSQNMEVNERHVVSIDVLIDGQPSGNNKQLSMQKRHRFTIMVGCNNMQPQPSRISVKRNNLQSVECGSKKNLGVQDSGSCHKYYFQRKNGRSRGNCDQLTQRKYQHGTTTSLHRIQNNSKSYRIHTIDYVEQDHKKQTLISDIKPTHPLQNKSSTALIDITRKKQNYLQNCKNKIKKKTIINQTDLTQFTTLSKNKNIITQKKEKEITINLKHRKYNKAKTQLQQNQIQNYFVKEDNLKYEKIQKNCRQVIKHKDYLLSERKCKQQSLSKKVQFKRNKMKSIITSLSQRDTFQLKNGKNQHMVSREQQQNIEYLATKKVLFQQKSPAKAQNNQGKLNSFNQYLDFINHKKKENKVSRTKGIKNLQQGKSMVVKTTLKKQTIFLQQNQKQNIKSKQLQQETPIEHHSIQKKQKFHQQNNNTFIKSSQKACHSKSYFEQFECSQIPQINQSSFLSQSAKHQIITKAFQVTETQTLLNSKLGEKKQNINTILHQQESPKKKKKKKQPKMSWIGRSDLRQAFPQRFFI